MRRVLAVVFASAMMVGVIGCQKDNHDMNRDNPKMMKGDACPHCPGKQTATADGKCPQCGMKMQQG